MDLRITRLAPSPTGALHLGNARTFLINWLLARQNGWNILLRIEDLDGPRIKRDADRQAMEDLHWLGLTWDRGPIYQSSRISNYREVINRLLAQGKAYPCICTRRESQLAASAPHEEDGPSVYPGTCRGQFRSIEDARQASGREPAVRFRVHNETVRFTDELAGEVQFDAATQLGDFVIAKADGTPAYQLAVVVDDSEMQVTNVVRGNDLLDSTARQILLYKALNLGALIPRYTHLPLVLGPDGRRLAKRHGDSRLSHYRARGISAGRILSQLAKWCGIAEISESMTAAGLIGEFRLSQVPREPITFSESDEAWLSGGKMS
jgi:glutamyl-tRNA synthetase